jgi:phosphate transport system permease protein
VKVIDAVAKYGITIGGLGVIAALALMIAFLVQVVIPLFKDADAELASTATIASSGESELVAMGVDENLKGVWTLETGGELRYYSVPLRKSVEDEGPSSDVQLVNTWSLSDIPVTSVSVAGTSLAVGRADGTVLFGEIDFANKLLRGEDIPEPLRDLQAAETRVFEDAIADKTRRGDVRLTRAEAELGEPMQLTEEPASGEGAAVEHIDYIGAGGYSAGRSFLVAKRADGRLHWLQNTVRENMMTGKKSVTVRRFELPAADGQDPADVVGVHLARNGESTYVIYGDGTVVWYDTSALTQPLRDGESAEARIAGVVEAAAEGVTITADEMLIGDYTLVLGDSAGGVSGWFPAQDDDGNWELVRAHVLAKQPGAITSISLSRRDRQFVTGDASGSVWLRHMTSGTVQARLDATDKAGIAVTATSPPMNAVVALADDGAISAYRIDNPHPDGKLPALFGLPQYEGRAQATPVYQSSSAGDDAEPKLSLWPLVWGTLKATIYAMLFATPIAILAAIYSSEFMQPSVRATVKPAVEMMAGLPSVVLGYLAAQVLAPWIEITLPGLLITFAAVPVGVMIFGFLWQLVPPSEVHKQGGYWALAGLAVVGVGMLLYFGGLPPMLAAVVWLIAAALLLAVVFLGGDEVGGYMPFVVMCELVIASILLGLAAGPLFETIIFGGDLRGWLRGAPEGWVADISAVATRDATGQVVDAPFLAFLPDAVTALPGWILLLTPICTIALVLVFNLYVRPNMALFDGRGKTRKHLAGVDLVRFAVVGLLGLAAATVLGLVLSLIGLDLRGDFLRQLTGGTIAGGGVLDEFKQRNALNVGMIMGFAIIPIIYTVSEDALAAVPNTLRSAALGAGATPWQTAIRVVLPVAISGIFSACMIGLGRAVGETMIVLMAAGNTPTMNLNIFDGLRALSANIATEMPEAVQGGTLYRVLFFSALLLFAMTFVVNTIAEFVRIRFRKRAFQL